MVLQDFGTLGYGLQGRSRIVYFFLGPVHSKIKAFHILLDPDNKTPDFTRLFLHHQGPKSHEQAVDECSKRCWTGHGHAIFLLQFRQKAGHRGHFRKEPFKGQIEDAKIR